MYEQILMQILSITRRVLHIFDRWNTYVAAIMMEWIDYILVYFVTVFIGIIMNIFLTTIKSFIELFMYMKFSTWSKVKFHVWIIKQTILSSLKSECQAWIYCWKIRFIRCSLSHTHTKSSYIKFENMMFKHSRTKIYSN